MKKVLFILLITHCSLLIVKAQTQFQLAIGGTAVDHASSIVRTTDGGYVVGGITQSFGAGMYDFYIVKLDGSSTLQWSRTVGGTGNDLANSIVQTTDGGYTVAGQTASFGAGNDDMYILKLDGSGTLQWSKTVGGISIDQASSIIHTTDGGYAVAGQTYFNETGYFDFYIVKLDGSGTLQWSRTVGGPGNDLASSIIQTTDGGYAVAGYTNSFFAGGDMYIVKLDSNGATQWSRTVGGTSGDEARSIIQTTDGGYAVAGWTASFGAVGSDMYIVKLDTGGTLQWSRTVGGAGADVAWSIIRTTDGGYAVAGETNSNGAGLNDFYIVKLDGSGTLQWTRTVGGTGNDFARSIIQTIDSFFVVAGWTHSFGAGNDDIYIVKLNSSGNTCGNSSSPSSISGTGGTSTSRTSTVPFPTPTDTSPTSLTGTGGTVTPICLVGIQPVSNELPGSYQLEQNHPNPFNPSTKISFDIPKTSFVKIVVYDNIGKEVETLVNEQLNQGSYTIEFDGSSLTSGVYYYKLLAGELYSVKKMVLIK